MEELISSCVSNSVRRAIAEAMAGFSPHSSGALVNTASSIPQKVRPVGFPCNKLTTDQTVPFATLNAKWFNTTSKANSVYEVLSAEELFDKQEDIGMVKVLNFCIQLNTIFSCQIKS